MKLLLFIIISLFIFIFYFISNENFIVTRNSIPNFLYPIYIPQPSGNKGFGYRNSPSTYQTILWEEKLPFRKEKDQQWREDRVPIWMNSNLFYPNAISTIPIKESNNSSTIKPPIIKIKQPYEATSMYSTW